MLKKEQGFTLVEVVVAIILMSLVTVAVVQIYNSNLFGIILSGERTEAIYDMQRELELEIAKEPGSRGAASHSVTIQFAGYDDVVVPGWIVSEDSEEVGPRDIKVSGTVFIPERKQGDEDE